MKEQPEKCFGFSFDLDAADGICRGCAVNVRCRSAYENRTGNSIPAEPDLPAEQIDLEAEENDSSPFEHLLMSLSGKFEREDKSGDSTDGIFFNLNGHRRVQIIIARSTGRVKLKTRSFERILDSVEAVETIEEAEELFRKMIQG